MNEWEWTPSLLAPPTLSHHSSVNCQPSWYSYCSPDSRNLPHSQRSPALLGEVPALELFTLVSDSIEGQDGWGFDQPGLLEGSLPIAEGLELDDLEGAFLSKPFYDCVIL